MNINGVYAVLYAWAKAVLPTVSVIKSHQNAPTPALPYIVINYVPTAGSSILEPLRGDVKADGSRVNVITKTGRVELWQVGGNGEHLETLVNSLSSESVYQTWLTNNLTFTGSGAITPVPQIKGEDWELECMVELFISYASYYNDTPGFISTVEATGELPKQAITGEHDINTTIGA